MKRVFAALSGLLSAEQERLLLWTPVCMGAGIAWYFFLLREPRPLYLAMTLIPLTACAWAARRRRVMLYICCALALCAFGANLASWRTLHIHAPQLSAPLAFAQTSGTIAAIEPTPKGMRLTLRDPQIEHVPPEQAPRFLTVTMRAYDPSLVTGQRIRLRAGLFPPPEPALPGGFDFSRYFYFREIGAVGYGIPPLTVLPSSGAEDFDIRFSEFRHRLTEAIRSYFHEPAGSVAAAFITGETRAIPDAVNDDMRIAGLYHLLAVSGMNLSVVAGLAFFTLRLALAAVPYVALRLPVKKWAAVLALLVSYAYLRVSGSPVSAERAFFMVSLIFVAIILDRDPMPMRSVAIAAFCILLYEPEALLTSSFQLSFSATAALIASYEWGAGWLARESRRAGFGLKRVALYFAAVMATSLVAWLATEPFIIYHFNQFSSYSLLANTIAEPLVSFILMPLVMAGVLLMPLHLAWIAFAPMQYGVDILLAIAHWTASLPHAMRIVPNPSHAGFISVALGLIWIYFWKTKWRWCGTALVIGGMATAFSYVPPDIIISADGKHIAARLDGGTPAMLKGRAHSVTADSWARAMLATDYAGKEDVPSQCDRAACVMRLRGRSFAWLKDNAALRDECALSDIVFVNTPANEPACKASLMIDKSMLDRGGSVAIYFRNAGMDVLQSRSLQGVRPWSPHASPNEGP